MFVFTGVNTCKYMEKKPSPGVWLWNILFEIEDFNLNDIVIYSMIYGLSLNDNDCFATNSYFAKKIKKTNDTVRKSITKLFELGYITSEINYNYKSNRVLGVTNKISTYLKTDKGLLKNNIVPLVKTSNNNIIDNIYINTTSTTKEKLEVNLDLIDSVCEDYKKEKEYVLNFINEFVKKNIEEQKVWDDDNDMFKHFKSSLAIKIKKENQKPKGKPGQKENKISNDELEKNLKWFMENFNSISGKTFEISDGIRSNFVKCFAVGFTGAQMKTAIGKLYSRDERNHFHKSNSYKFATPFYLLGKDHMNTYLNAEWQERSLMVVKRARRLN